MSDAVVTSIRQHRIPTAVLSDTLDSMGLRHQAMQPHIRPLDLSLDMAGRARTGLYMPVYHVAEGLNPYELEIQLIDDLKPDEVVVLACGDSGRIAPWGELLTTACIARKAVGCVTDGLVRDVRQISEVRFPVFHGGIGPLDSKGRGRVMEIEVPVMCAGVLVRPQDVVVGDADGVVVIPRDAEEQVLARALDKVTGENNTRDALRQGESLASVFQRFGIL
ncbi:MAG TPA: RraA family protein [Lautropia sp.]|nr:RraA family protein [Lautropia sp.]